MCNCAFDPKSRPTPIPDPQPYSFSPTTMIQPVGVPRAEVSTIPTALLHHRRMFALKLRAELPSNPPIYRQCAINGDSWGMTVRTSCISGSTGSSRSYLLRLLEVIKGFRSPRNREPGSFNFQYLCVTRSQPAPRIYGAIGRAEGQQTPTLVSPPCRSNQSPLHLCF